MSVFRKGDRNATISTTRFDADDSDILSSSESATRGTSNCHLDTQKPSRSSAECDSRRVASLAHHHSRLKEKVEKKQAWSSKTATTLLILQEGLQGPVSRTSHMTHADTTRSSRLQLLISTKKLIPNFGRALSRVRSGDSSDNSYTSSLAEETSGEGDGGGDGGGGGEDRVSKH
ncbi:hypothetical protein C0Q70_14960 [Pomacea canaliculata]|uniref:Uncharacterized protein n=1 Tax=Pomacea canaliculata TaxID=400727 RepID=A0A2T7NTH2_POMCA|nr:hypothetical protein C0Q70_14960 [Pomacea canaliculata]